LLQTACHSLSKNVFPALMLFFFKKKIFPP
jgi:hypothetical protein